MSKKYIQKEIEGGDDFVTMPNVTVQDKGLSWSARGLLTYISSKPPDWRVYVSELCKNSTDGITATRRAFNELKAAGFVRSEIIREKGRIISVEYYVYKRNVRNQPKKPELGFLDLEKLDLEKLDLENLTLQSKDNTNKDNTNKDYTKGVDFPFPSDAFKGAWIEWYDYRKEVKKPLTKAAITKLFKKLSAVSEKEAIRAIDDSISNGWTGLFPKEEKTGVDHIII